MDQSEIDWAARSIIDRFGIGAEKHATEKVERMLKRGDLEEAANWMKIVQAVVDAQGRPADRKRD